VHYFHELTGFFGLQWLEDSLFSQAVNHDKHVAVRTTVQRAWGKVLSKIHRDIKPLSLWDGEWLK
jgi:hypothetical protein